MLDFVKRNFTFIAVVVGTVVLLVGGVFLFSGEGSTKEYNQSLLVGEKSFQTNPGSSVTLVEFGDFQCPACASYHDLVKPLLSEFEGKLNYVFRHYPLPQHGNAYVSSYAFEAARVQGKAIEMADLLYGKQNDWASASDAKTIFVEYAKGLGLDEEKFKSDMDSNEVKDIVAAGYADGNAAGIRATPTFFLNGEKLSNVSSLESFRKLIQDKLK